MSKEKKETRSADELDRMFDQDKMIEKARDNDTRRFRQNQTGSRTPQKTAPKLDRETFPNSESESKPKPKPKSKSKKRERPSLSHKY